MEIAHPIQTSAANSLGNIDYYSFFSLSFLSLILSIYYFSHTQLSNEKIPQTPSFFIEVLKSGKATPQDVTSLRIELNSRSNQWINDFVKPTIVGSSGANEGINALLICVEDVIGKIEKK